ncbi:cytochrome P450 3A8-like [Haliotis rufescens]|uniref:cytochrome P450 3A8-like n=1 Tax=Haliotis rufescens TaxID=6454 RepID=UPI00201EAD95|nr:cytochrome P450 3A8-like [Haliotis rufescens]XP_048243851.1 cytochrome P450 3A8-like [Haliotis rufescens]
MGIWMAILYMLLCGVVLTLAYVWYMTRKYGVFKELGVKGPKPAPVLGHFHILTSEGAVVAEKKWYREYKKDKAFGIFEGGYPMMFITDINIMKEVLMKKFHCFVNRRAFEGVNDYPLNYAMTTIQDDHWKHVRSLLSPTFSSGKLKKMVGLVNKTSDNLVQNFRVKAESGEEFEVKELTGAYTMDTICSTAFGIEIDSKNDPNNAFVTGAQAFFKPKVWLIILIFFFPFLAPLLKLLNISLWPKSLTHFFVKVTDDAIKQRRSSTQKSNDFLQMMIDAEVGSEEVDKEIDHSDSLMTSQTWNSKGLTTNDIHGQALTFLIAGYDTTATTMAFLIYELALNPDICERAIQEVDRVLGDNHDVSYEQCAELHYLDMCVSESLRLFPPATRFDRHCTQDVEVCGIKIPSGMDIAIPVIAIHYDEEYWPDPERFDPERFTPEAKGKRNPLAYVPFGAGPRNCIGMRLSLMEAKIGIARLLQNFKPIRSEKTQVPMTFKKIGILEAENGIWVKMLQRHK